MYNPLMRFLLSGKVVLEKTTCVLPIPTGKSGFYGLCVKSSASKRPISASFSTAVESQNEDPAGESHKMSKAMKAYMERAKAHDEFIVDQIADYEIGRRHLANIMGENPETFTDEDKDRAIAYLFPSGLFEPRARPFMKHPLEIFQKKKAAEFDMTGRPFHHLFYTALPNYYQVLHDITKNVMELDRLSTKMNHFDISPDNQESLNIDGSAWLKKEEFDQKILETVKDDHYEFFIRSMDRLIAHPLAYKVRDFIMEFRKDISVLHQSVEIPKLMYTVEGIPYMTANGKRKSSRATVTVYGRGSGKIKINGRDILYFPSIQDREQVVYPLDFTGLLGKVDVEAQVEEGGSSGQSGAIRHATSLCLRSFVNAEMIENMRLAGLLTNDPRRKERKKPGQKGARAKFTWKKR